jgi:hypothetical protein
VTQKPTSILTSKQRHEYADALADGVPEAVIKEFDTVSTPPRSAGSMNSARQCARAAPRFAETTMNEPLPSVRATDAARVDRRRKLPTIFFAHQPGSRDEKIRQAYAVLDESQSVWEFDPLRRLLAQLRAVLNACPPSEHESRPNA